MKKINLLVILLILLSACSLEKKGKLYVEELKWGGSGLYILNTSTKDVIEFSVLLDGESTHNKKLFPQERKLVVLIDIADVRTWEIIDAKVVEPE